MENNSLFIQSTESIITALKHLYRSYGYKKYRISRFEELELYLENKAFLNSGIVSFTAPDGSLKALRPDVTLSIVKSVCESSSPQKLYYNENVYRTSRTGDVSEIMQIGLESIGESDAYSTAEVLLLACDSLKLLCSEYIIDLSHMGFIYGLVKYCGLMRENISEITFLLSQKSIHGLYDYCIKAGVEPQKAKLFSSLAEIGCPMAQGLEKLKKLAVNQETQTALHELCEIYGCMKIFGSDDCLRLDFSVVNDMSYYNGIVFSGYISGIPQTVLLGGRYDLLLTKFGKSAGAAGFAVYAGMLERYMNFNTQTEVDVLLVYGDAPAEKVSAAVCEIEKSGKTVRALRVDDKNTLYGELVIL